RRATPQLRKVGVLTGTSPVAEAHRQALNHAAQQQGLTLVIEQVESPEAVFPSLRKVLAEAQVLLLLPDGALAGPATLQRMLIAAYRQRVPVVTYSPALVKAGAAIGLYASPQQVGRQVMGMLKGSLNAPSLAASWPAPQVADDFTIYINEQ